MHKHKLFSTGLILAMVVVIALGAVWQPAAAGRLHRFRLVAGDTIELGKQGLSITNIPHEVTYALAGPAQKPLPRRFIGTLTLRL